MNKQQILSYSGSMQQVAYIRPVTHSGGQAKGLTEYLIRNGKLSFNVMGDKCLDISELNYKGINMSFLSKPGLQHLGQLGSQSGVGSIMGGFLFTAGMQNICASSEIEGRSYAMHGNLRSLPAEHLGTDAYWEGDEYVMKLNGEVRESELFGENLLLRRTITTRFLSKSFIIEDTVENQSFSDEVFYAFIPFQFRLSLSFGSMQDSYSVRGGRSER